jgi:glycerophosphoryl diester phosphodiesterase
MAAMRSFATILAVMCSVMSGQVIFMNGTAMAFDIEAHRGGRALFPENTLPSFANALSLGVDTL